MNSLGELIVFRKFICALGVFFFGLDASLVLAQDSRLIVGQASIDPFTIPNSTTVTPFQRIDFPSPFAAGTVPNVFAMTPEFGAGTADDPCTIRIRSIDNEGFEATCLEPRNEDRNSPGFVFDYVAIENGTVNVPLAGGNGNVRFESACEFVDSQVFGPNCDDCDLANGETQGFERVTFDTAFAAAPSLITQIQSVNNTFPGGDGLPGGEPEFLDVAVRNNSLTASRFDVAIDRMEAGNGLLNNGENICYLAVERGGCQELDLSSLNGPSSVFFQSVFGDDVLGHDNPVAAGSGASFAPNCFTSTPVSVAKQRSRRGNNGGFLRRVDITAAGTTFVYDEDRVSDNERSHIREEISVLAFSSTFTTPVTLNFVRFDQQRRRLNVRWETSAETFHLGFHVWGETSDGWQQLNRRLIPAQGGDSNEKREYQTNFRLSREQANSISRFGLSTIDNSSHEEFYGPFETGIDYGEQSTGEAIDWQATRDQFEDTMRAKGYVEHRGRWVRSSAARRARIDARNLGLNRSLLNLQFDQAGVHRVDASRLLAELPAWNKLDWSRVAVTLNGEAVARYIDSTDDKLSSDDSLYFYVRKPSGRDQVYLDHYNYQIRIDRRLALDAGVHNGSEFDAELDGVQTLGIIQTTLTTDKAYSASIKGDDPWFDARLLAFSQPARADFALQFDHAIEVDQPFELEFSLFGGIDIPGEGDDHHAQVWVNEQLVADIRFDGLEQYSRRIEIPGGVLNGVSDTVSVVVPGDTGFIADLILVDRIDAFAKTNIIETRPLRFQAFAQTQNIVKLDGNAQSDVFAHTENGAFRPIDFKALAQGQIAFAGLPVIGGLAYSVGDIEQWPQPSEIKAESISQLHASGADYWIIAHPQFMNTDLQRFAELKREQGHTVSLVNWLDLVSAYGFGNNTPSALDRFLTRANTNQTIKHALIVGGHTYDYLGVIDAEVVNFIPTHYRPVSVFNFSPTDNQFADLDGDNKPEFAIGRWPVRSAEDLSAIVSKTEVWHQNRAQTQYQNALLIAQQPDNRGLQFDDQIRAYVGNHLQQDSEFDQIKEVYLEELFGEGLSIADAQAQIVDTINQGAELISFAGHGSDAAWSFDSIVDTDLVQSLSNAQTPAMVMPLACYTTNYESLSVNTLAHQWLFAGTQGAAAIHGAMVLGQYRENAVFAQRYLRQTEASPTVGEAILNAKSQMSPANQMLDNWALLGDPALPLR